MIYTGYYAKLKKYKEDGLYPVAISLTTPVFFNGDLWEDVAPKPSTLWKYKKGEIDEFQFTEDYKEWLNELDKEQIRKDLQEALREHSDIVLLCYEKTGGFCHRHILADWIEEHLGYVVKEYLD